MTMYGWVTDVTPGGGLKATSSASIPEHGETVLSFVPIAS
jgi:hypothetical protein